MKTYNYSLKNKHLHDLIDFSHFSKEDNLLVQIFCGQGKDILEITINLILERLPQAVCIGTTTDGEIINNEASTFNTVISISTFENTQVKTAYAQGSNSYENGISIANELISSNTKLLILFTDGTTTNGEEFLKGIESINNKVMISGGMAGDNANFTQTYISSGNKIFENGAVAVALNSEILKVHNDYNFNWSPIGIEHTIDEVRDNRVLKISGISLLEFYEKYLGEYVAKSLPATGIEFPLILERNGILIARAVVAKHQDGSLSFAGNLHQGDKVKLGFGNVEMIMNNPFEHIFNTCNNTNTESFFIYSCMARRRYIPEIINLELEPFANITSTSGFFTYGEFFHNKGHNELLNQTLTVVALSESTHIINMTKQEPLSNKKQMSEHSRSIQALTHLIQKSSEDYKKQTQRLEVEKTYSNNLLTAQKNFLKYAVHETNTPLSVIMSNIELFEMEFGKNRYLSNIEVAMKNIFSIYDDLSYLVKKDQMMYKIQNIDIVDFVRSRIDFFSQNANLARSNFIFDYENSEIFISFIETKLQRIIDNNLTNAIKYTLENRDIFVSLKQSVTKVALIISSHSRLIQHPDKIFEEYYREEKTQEGFGLGLNLVKRICDEEDVNIHLESNEELTTFTYTFKGIM